MEGDGPGGRHQRGNEGVDNIIRTEGGLFRSEAPEPFNLQTQVRAR